MGFSSPLQNLSGFASSRPPLVVFIVCLAAFALTTLSLAYFIRGADNVRDPRITLDWNVFLGHISELDFCIQNSKVTSSRIPHTAKPLTLDSEEEEAQAHNHSFSVLAPLTLGPGIGWLTENITQLHGIIKGHQIGEGGEVSKKELRTIFEIMTPNGSNVDNICIFFEGPHDILPRTKSPPTCYINDSPGSIFAFNAQHRDEEIFSGSWCSEGTLIHMAYQKNPELSVMLSMHDRSIINLHLMYTSYFLFVMVLTLLCYALVRGPIKTKNIQVEKLPLDP